MEPAPGHGGAPGGVCRLRREQRHGCTEVVRVRDGEHGAPQAHPSLGDGIRPIRSFLAVPGSISLAPFNDFPGR